MKKSKKMSLLFLGVLLMSISLGTIYLVTSKKEFMLFEIIKKIEPVKTMILAMVL